MKLQDRVRLTTALRHHVGRIAADLRAKMRAQGSAARVATEQLHKDERVAEDFEVWTDLLSRRAAVLWVLKSVYVRVLEDRGLLQPGRLLDPEAQQLFEKLAPNLGETAFLRWIYKDLASTRGGVPELFSPQPAEVAQPSDDLSRALIAFWRHRDADTGAVWSFAEEKFEGELMGDLYQELDPVVKDRFALCQTPDFVRAFILDRTLTPAIETFGTDEVRLLDPACGSGHFLIDGLKRLVAATAEKHKDWSREKVVTQALNRVVGIDLNDYACALARTRLIMTAAELTGVTKLADAARFHPHVYWADGLEQVEKEEQKPTTQFDLFKKVEEKPRATLTRSDVRAALKKVFAAKFHAVVANPPYINEEDDARKAYHRERIGNRPRYRSAYMQYSLGGPFLERALELAVESGFVGFITSNNFTKSEFGKPLIEDVLTRADLTGIVDTSQAFIPHHGTPTIIIFARNRCPAGDEVLVVSSKKGETRDSTDPEDGAVWQGIKAGWMKPGYEDSYVSAARVTRKRLSNHPWLFGASDKESLFAKLEDAAESRLVSKLSDLGRTSVCGIDEIFLMSRRDAARLRTAELLKPFVAGEQLRDWTLRYEACALYPYETFGGNPIPNDHTAVTGFFWRYRKVLRERTVFGKSPEQRNGAWYEHLEHYKDRLLRRRSLSFPNVATHNHFVYQQETRLCNAHAPILHLIEDNEAEHLWLLGLLNSSALAFWLRQVSSEKGGESTGKKRQSEVWARRLEYRTTKLKFAPLPAKHRSRIIEIARRLNELGEQCATLRPTCILEGTWSPEELPSLLESAEQRAREIRDLSVTLQEELDWTVYAAFGLISDDQLPLVDSLRPMASQHRPFAIRMARLGQTGSGTTYWFQAMGLQPCTSFDEIEDAVTRRNCEARLALLGHNPDIALLESPEYKRKWEPLTFSSDFAKAASCFLADLIEDVMQKRTKVVTATHLVNAVQSDARFLSVASCLQERRDVDVSGIVSEIISSESVPDHPHHVYTTSGLAKRKAWESIWETQRAEDSGKGESLSASSPTPPEYSQGSRGKSRDFLRTEYWQLRGKLDVPKERFIAFTEVPNRSNIDTLYGWAGWTPVQRLKAILSIDEELEDASVSLADRIGLLDSAWRLLPEVAREDAATAARLKAELQSLVGPEGPSRELVEDWKKRFPPPSARAARARKVSTAEVDEEDEILDDLPSVIPNVSEGDHAAILIWSLLHASGGTATRMDLARAFALRARPALLKKLAPASLKREVAHWALTVGSRSAKAGLLTSTLNALAARNGVSLGTDSEARSTVSTSPFTQPEAQIDPWFIFEANLALKVLRAQPEEKFSVIDKALTGADRKLLENVA